MLCLASARERARLSLEGLSVGDAFGERFFGNPEKVARLIRERSVVWGTWRYTDDTEMALSIVAELEDKGRIDQDALAQAFATRMSPDRGYGAGAYQVLTGIRAGGDWRHLSRAGFRGRGSFGNGAAMRAAPVGAYFAEDLPGVVDAARAASEVTHAHAEGIAGGIAVAVAAALMWQRRGREIPVGRDWLREVRAHVPEGEVAKGIDEALALPASVTTLEAASVLGNGSGVTAPDTVPFCLWVSAWHSTSYEEALWQTVSALGDRDTTCAIVGGIVALHGTAAAIPEAWLDAREELP